MIDAPIRAAWARMLRTRLRQMRAGEACPVWPGQPATAHWSYEDPSRVQASHDEQLYAFKHVLHALHQRLELLMSLPLSRLDKFMLEHHARQLAPQAR